MSHMPSCGCLLVPCARRCRGPPMEAKALTPQDLTSDLTTPAATVPVDTVALTVANGRSVAAPANPPDTTQDRIIARAATRVGAPTFEQLGVAEPICAALAAAGIT